ncbi:protein Skeletor, isoforms B/C isoform X2 [Euwallacea fornicatus]|uniref:protein Skeletor, isoforms B/C isoform X2 n=1 Tax=Euwallacea fornicatus TaxID=995702 RepID=UPI00338ECF59
MAKIGPLVFAALATCFIDLINAEYIGKFLGKLSELHHGVSGEVYAVDGRTIHIKDFTYDGQGPAAYFYASTYKTADSRGFRLRDENNNGDVIRRYRKEGVTLTLPEGKNLNNIKIFYVWCEEFDVNFGDIKIPRNFDFPRPQKIDALKGVHSISSDNIVIVDAQTLLIPNLHYDGEAPDAKFWVGRGPKPSPQGIRVPDENGKEVPLRRYDAKTVVLTLPGDLTVFDIGHFGIWCEQFTVDFGHIQIPQVLNIPPSLKMLGISPQKRHQLLVPDNSREVLVRRPQIGGHLQPTTFRPPHMTFQRRYENDVLVPQQNYQQGYVPFHQYQQQQQQYQPQFVHQSRQLFPIAQNQGSQFLRQFVGHYQPYNGQAVPYQPLYDQRQVQERADYQQRFEYTKPRNRFDFQNVGNQQQNYAPLGQSRYH